MQAADSERARAITPWLFDGALALMATGFSLSLLITPLGRSERPSLAAPAVTVLVLVHTLSLTVRRRAPVAVLTVQLITGAAVLALGYPMVFLGFAVPISVYTVGARCPRRTAVAALGAVLAVLALNQLGPNSSAVDTWIGNTLVLGAAWLIGDGSRRRQETAVMHQRRATQLEHAQQELAKQAVSQERLRIARELHDVVGHAMSVIAVLSGNGRLVVDHDPHEAGETLAAIERTSRDALREMRQVLGALRESEAVTESLAPLAGLENLDELVARVAGSGLPVQVSVDGRRPVIPTGIDLAAYRIVQEALTNVVKHAGPATARVHVRYDDDQLIVEVTDDGKGSADGLRDGNGTIGMRERTSMWGGDLEMGPWPPGGWRVWARLPLEVRP